MKAILCIALLASTAAASADPISNAPAAARASARQVVATQPASVRVDERDEVRADVALRAADEQVALTRRAWDAAIAADHPVAAGHWARRHFEALQARRSAFLRWQSVADRVSAARGTR